MSGALDFVGDAVEGVFDTIDDNPLMALGIAAGAPLMLGPTVAGAATADALTGIAATNAGVDALGAGVAGGLAGNVAVAPTAAGMTALSGLGNTQLGLLAEQNAGLFADPWAAAASEMALPGSSYEAALPAGPSLSPMDAMRAANMMGGGQPQPQAGGGSMGGMPGTDPAESFMNYAPNGGFQNISPTANILDDVIRRGMLWT